MKPWLKILIGIIVLLLVIFVVIPLVLIFVGLGVYYGTTSSPTIEGFGVINVASPWDYLADGSLRFRVENRAGQSVTLTRLWITDPSTDPITNGDLVDLTDVQLSPGQTSNFITAKPVNPQTGSTGDRYSIKVTIEYRTANQLFNSTGTLSGVRS